MHKHMLVAIDGSAAASSALEQALSLASQLQARLTLLTVTEPWSAFDLAESSQAGISNPLADFEEMNRQWARNILGPAARQAEEAGVVSDTVHVADRRPAEAIVEEAKARGCDLIVMGSHGRRGVDRLILGSQTARVLALTTQPVLVYRKPAVPDQATWNAEKRHVSRRTVGIELGPFREAHLRTRPTPNTQRRGVGKNSVGMRRGFLRSGGCSSIDAEAVTGRIALDCGTRGS